jgi:hypothetical protein
MKTFSTQEAVRQLRKLFDAKALLSLADSELHPLAQDDLEARAALCAVQIDAMNHAEDGFELLKKVLQNLAGTEMWPKALEIAYAPNEFDGYQRVAEYYRRIEAIQQL